MTTDTQHIDVDRKPIDILITVANSYTRDTRARDEGGSCVYRSAHNPPRNCGLGMWFDPKLTPEWVWEYRGSIYWLENELIQRGHYGLDEILIERARGLSQQFWADVQGLHDASELWDKTGLNELGWRVLLSRIDGMCRTVEEA